MGELNIEKLKSRITKVISSDEALKDVEPIDLPDDVINGKKKIVIDKAEKDCDNKCVKLGILY
ncbi:MAG: hypothetical protein IJ141_00100 [Lachnospiraceae bacterium]|nr:hypothetical protein [Lachnospiraceae bacterium]